MCTYTLIDNKGLVNEENNNFSYGNYTAVSSTG